MAALNEKLIITDFCVEVQQQFYLTEPPSISLVEEKLEEVVELCQNAPQLSDQLVNYACELHTPLLVLRSIEERGIFNPAYLLIETINILELIEAKAKMNPTERILKLVFQELDSIQKRIMDFDRDAGRVWKTELQMVRDDHSLDALLSLFECALSAEGGKCEAVGIYLKVEAKCPEPNVLHSLLRRVVEEDDDVLLQEIANASHSISCVLVTENGGPPLLHVAAEARALKAIQWLLRTGRFDPDASSANTPWTPAEVAESVDDELLRDSMLNLFRQYRSR